MAGKGSGNGPIMEKGVRQMALIDKMAEDIRRSGDNIFELVLIEDGKPQMVTIHPVSPCQDCYSVTKSFIATGIGMLADRGELSLQDPIVKFFRQELPERTDDKLYRVTVENLLTQTSGHEQGFLFEGDRFSHGPDWLGYTLSQPLKYEPGTHFTYSNATYYLLSCIIHRVTGVTAETFLRTELFTPLGIEDYAWSCCPKGETQGGTGLYLSTWDMAKLGILYLNQGVYEGKRLLSEGWVREATENQVKTPEADAYGYSFWPSGNEGGYSCNGANQQMVLVLPEENLVLAGHGYASEYDYRRLLRRAQGKL